LYPGAGERSTYAGTDLQIYQRKRASIPGAGDGTELTFCRYIRQI